MPDSREAAVKGGATKPRPICVASSISRIAPELTNIRIEFSFPAFEKLGRFLESKRFIPCGQRQTLTPKLALRAVGYQTSTAIPFPPPSPPGSGYGSRFLALLLKFRF